MKFLTSPPKFIFFTGKGGVGKTSVACATAVFLARKGSSVLLVSTDPASNVGQVFGQSLSTKASAIEGVPGLEALEIDPQAAAQQYRSRIVDPVRGKLPEAVVKGIEEQLSGACTTEIAAFDEFTSLLTDKQFSERYNHIIFDTAPTGHTIRLLQLPGAWSGFLEAGKGDASCLGPLAGLDKQREQYAAAVSALTDPESTRLVLVSRAQRGALAEAERTQEELAALGLNNQHLVINGILPKSEASVDSLAAAIYNREQLAIAEMPATLQKLPRDEIELKPFNIVGVETLEQLFGQTSLTPEIGEGSSFSHPRLSSLIESIAAEGHGLIMVMGKGGVGKTTVAAAVAIDLANRGKTVHLSTSDPAAHLTETVAGELPNLVVSRIDPAVETTRYREHVLATKGAKLDEQGRKLLEEDLRSPCTEEIAVFQAFSRIIRESASHFVVMDTAPTGHTLLLLDATGAYHREIVRQAAPGTHFTTPMMRLQDQNQTKVIIVTLAETTPVLEAKNLQSDLIRAGIRPWAWVVNQSLSAADPKSALLKARAATEAAQIAEVQRSAEKYAVVALQAEEPVGIVRLRRLISGAEESVTAANM